MDNLTTPKSILFGLGLIALAIASVPYSTNIIKPANASEFVLGEIADNIKVSGNRVSSALYKIHQGILSSCNNW